MVVQMCPCSRAKTRQSNCYYTGERPRGGGKLTRVPTNCKSLRSGELRHSKWRRRELHPRLLFLSRCSHFSAIKKEASGSEIGRDEETLTRDLVELITGGSP